MRGESAQHDGRKLEVVGRVRLDDWDSFLARSQLVRSFTRSSAGPVPISRPKIIVDLDDACPEHAYVTVPSPVRPPRRSCLRRSRFRDRRSMVRITVEDEQFAATWLRTVRFEVAGMKPRGESAMSQFSSR